MLNNQENVVSSKIKTEKEAWSTPILTELSIESETQNNNSGPSLNDGGDAFNDYNS